MTQGWTMTHLQRPWTEAQEVWEAEAKERKALEEESKDKALMLREAVAGRGGAGEAGGGCNGVFGAPGVRYFVVESVAIGAGL